MRGVAYGLGGAERGICSLILRVPEGAWPASKAAKVYRTRSGVRG